MIIEKQKNVKMFYIFKTSIINVPAMMSTSPVKDLIVSFSLNTKYENTIDTTMLKLIYRHYDTRKSVPAVPCNSKTMSRLLQVPKGR